MMSPDSTDEASSFNANPPEASSSEIVRPSISLQERDVDLLDEMAAKQYAGNWSACLRAAIKDHARSLEGENEFEVQKLVAVVRDLEEKVEQIQNSIEEGPAEEPTPVNNESQTVSQSSGSKLQYQVYEQIPVDGTASLSEIASKLDESLIEIENRLEKLRQRGIVTRETTSESIKYEIDTSRGDLR